MAGWFFGPLIEKIRNTCFDYLQDQVVLHADMNEALERLQKLQPKIQSVIFASNQEQIIDQNPALNRWLWQLRDAIDEADDVLDDFEYMKLEEQLNKNNDESEKRKAPSSASVLIESVQKIYKVSSDRVIKIHPKLNRLKEAVQKLDKASAEVSTFLHLLESTKQVQQEQHRELHRRRETGSLPTNDLIGRGNDKEFVMQWLRNSSNEHPGTGLYRNISLLSIVGHGGMGKTTLLQHVYEEDETTKKFDLKMWVCVSNNFDVKKVITDMLESLKKEKPDDLDSLDALQGKLKEEVMSKRLLLVLDDIWGEEEERDKGKWENVLAPLSCASLGSKILVTTRMDSAALIIAKVIKKKKETLTLQGLEEDECLQLLNTHAFADVENLDDQRKLKLITEEIAKKLSGSPLAAKVMGGILNSNLDEMHWRKVLDCDTGIIKDDIMHVLRLSYEYLPQSLQSCFRFCCIFPQDHEFDKDDLVRMWIALGFIQPSCNQGETMEDIGERYFDTLVKKSFFDKYDNCYKMHDLLHELAQCVSGQECFRIEGKNELSYRIPETIRHLAVNTNNLEVVRKIERFKNLHSLHITYSKDDQDFTDVLTKNFETLTSIRVLCINNQHQKMIPEAIRYLRHLRYLRIARTVSQLPRSLSNLYHLMFIIYDKGALSVHNDFLPKDLNNLIKLRYLDLPWDRIDGIHGIGKLKSLQGLDGFYVKNEIGYKIGELEHMNDLRQLRIELLENVKDAEEACSAKLYQKRNLMDLSLDWNRLNINDWYLMPETSRNIIHENVLDNLQPHNNLKRLRIYSFMGARSAKWMNNIDLLSNLEYIRLENCLEWQTLPPFGHLPFLKSLLIRNMPKAKLLDNKFHENGKDCLFPSLEVLDLSNLEALQKLPSSLFISSLKSLRLRGILLLKSLPDLPPSLKHMSIMNLPQLQLLPNIPASLEKLILLNIEALQCLPSSLSISSLKSLDLDRIPLLKSLPDIPSGLKYMSVVHVPQLQLWPNIPASLERLNLSDLKALQYLPSSLSISSLERLHLTRIPLLKSLPDLPPGLKYLAVMHVPQLQLWPNIPASLEELNLSYLKALQCLPSSLSISSLKRLHLARIPLLKSLPDLPPSLTSLSVNNVPQLQLLPNIPASLEELKLSDLEALQCLSSSLSIPSLKNLDLERIHLLKSLPDLPPDLKCFHVNDCHPELMERYQSFYRP